ncbi:F-box/FBD/LRR-repeat protein At1g13570-like [Rutidosis leptorrhynchoides]|uniref:F-box/FBD/LRR-repeat protein At1g13570-like n=1 Tax=Rutidosis leptorrhynchoides TaxID=125765 RepID=UPI003A996C63
MVVPDNIGVEEQDQYNHKRMFVTSAETNNLSKLPDNLVDSILERLPIQDAVRTSILSRNWRYTWTTMRLLVLDEHFSNKLAKNGTFGYSGFIRVINQLFYFLKAPILKVHLFIPKMLLDIFQEVNQWILRLSRDCVRKLVLINSNQSYQLPSYLFYCSELRYLKLKNCIFKPPLEFQGFVYLEVLWLQNIAFGANLSETFNVCSFLELLEVSLLPLQFSIAENIPNWLPRAADRLARLQFYNFNFSALDQLQGALFMLRNSPNLEQLSVILGLGLRNMHLDEKSALTYLAASESFDQSLNRLKTINMKLITGSRPLLLFIKLLLDHSPALEVLSIQLSVTCNVHEKYNFAKDVMRLPRASSKVELLFLDP